jgi:hypothetical protein
MSMCPLGALCVLAVSPCTRLALSMSLCVLGVFAVRTLPPNAHHRPLAQVVQHFFLALRLERR